MSEVKAAPTALARVANGDSPLTTEEFAAFLKKRAELKVKHGEGPDARAKILEEFLPQLTENETLSMLNFVLWDLWKSGSNDSVLIAAHEANQ